MVPPRDPSDAYPRTRRQPPSAIARREMSGARARAIALPHAEAKFTGSNVLPLVRAAARYKGAITLKAITL